MKLLQLNLHNVFTSTNYNRFFQNNLSKQHSCYGKIINILSDLSEKQQKVCVNRMFAKAFVYATIILQVDKFRQNMILRKGAIP